MPTAKKVETVTKLTEALKDAKSIVFTDYRGLTHKQLEDFRRTLKKVGGMFVIAKNTLLTRAFGSTTVELSGPTGTLIATQDEVAPLKELSKLIKTAQLPVIKFGFLGTTRIDKDAVLRLASLPTKDVLIGQFVGGLIAPVYALHNALTWNLRKLVYALSAVKEKKGIMKHES